MLLSSTCSSPSRAPAPWGSASSRCCAPATPAPLSASCPQKAEKLARNPHSGLARIKAWKSLLVPGVKSTPLVGELISNPRPLMLPLFSQTVRRTSTGLPFYTQSRIHPSPLLRMPLPEGYPSTSRRIPRPLLSYSTQA